MNRLLILPLTLVMIMVCAYSQEKNDDFVLIQGGAFINQKSNYYERKLIISDFYIGKY